jgi:DNA-binding NtrC family response regulator
LAERFVNESAAKFDRLAPVIGDDFKAALLNHKWPGNVRELANVIEASVLLCEDSRLRIENLHGIEPADTVSKKEPLAQAEKKALLKALEKFDGNRQQTADYLKMSKRNLIYKLKKHDLLNKNKK